MNHPNASRFVRKRRLLVTDRRIRQILWYVIECHLIFLGDKITYSQKWVKANTTHKFEDYLKFRLVEDYLVRHKKLLQVNISELEEITFSCETQKEYIDTDTKLKPDKIDIYINKIGLRNLWKEEDENVYFAIECKRIKILSDTTDYVKDIEKFTKRNHTNLRLPFEGQIAFIENEKLNYKNVTDKINKKLKKSTAIKTLNPLTQTKLHASFTGAYLSKHKKNFGKKQTFSIYHLLFDYSGVVVK